jgi:SEC-C motif-containing protein
MRSRYAAFARGEVDYLANTLCAEHPDRTETAAVDYRAAREGLRYLDLSILHTSMDGDVGEVLFYARIFESGQDRSFVELSGFVREEGKWKYASGVMVRTEDLPPDPRTMTRDDVLGKSEGG